MYKRTLMLTAATVALLSGPAYAAGPTPVGTSDTTPLKTSTSGNITFPANATLTIASSSSAPAAAAVTIDSNNTVVVMEAGSNLTFSGTTGAIGVQMNQALTGELVAGGTINLIGSGTGKTGILIGNTALTSTAPFIGIKDPTNNTADPTAKTAAILVAGSVLNVTGDSSYGIHLAAASNVTGDIVVNGIISMQPTNLTSTASVATTGVEIDGNMTGNLLVGSAGGVEGVGAQSRGVIVLGNITGYIQNLGLVSTTGSNSPAANGTNPTAGTAFVVSSNVSGGFYNGGSLATGDNVGAATIESTGNAAALIIEPGFGGLTAANITLGGYSDPGTLGTFSFINRGSVVSAPLNENDNATGLILGSVAGTATSRTTLTNGLLNTGTISATANTKLSSTTTTPVTATAISIGQFTTVTGGILNSNQTSSGNITAIVSGPGAGIASGILISANATVPVLTNSGTILAQATTSDATNTSETAIGILDGSGTLLTINNNGAIKATGAAIVNGTLAQLNNNAQISQAINLAQALGNITINNTGNGTITGDIVLGGFNDTITTSGITGSTVTSGITGNINFGSGNNTLIIGQNSQVVGDLIQNDDGVLNISVASHGLLDATNNGLTTSNRTITAGTARNIVVSNLNVAAGGQLELTVSNAYNLNNTINNAGPIVEATPTGSITLAAKSTLAVNFGGFVTADTVANGTAAAARFVLFDASSGHLSIDGAAQNALLNGIPFLFNGSVCAYGAGLTGFTNCTGANPIAANHSDVVLSLAPKSATDLGLTGYAAAMFAPANEALTTDNALGAAVISAGIGINPATQKAAGNAFYQSIYSAFAPDVTGSARAIAISITDQSSGIVGERQRKLRMYAGQDSDATLWAQEFGQRLNVPNKVTAGGYANTGFGMAVGMDGGSISSGRYGAALTFYAGDTSEKEPRLSKTNSEWYMLTGYSDWRGKGLFFDSQINVAYGNLRGKRTIAIDDFVTGQPLITPRTAEGKRSSEMASGGFSTGFIMNWGGTVFMPQISVDALTLREEGYTETGGGTGMDLHVEPYYANSLRGFLGADLRQDLKMGDFFLQPEVRAGFRYDALDGAAKLHVNFAGDQSLNPQVAAGNPFTITGPDPARGNIVLGGGLAVTTDAWSIGVNYDYARGVGGTRGVNQDAMLTLIGRI